MFKSLNRRHHARYLRLKQAFAHSVSGATDDVDNVFTEFANELQQKIKYNQMIKHSNTSCKINLSVTDYQHTFVLACLRGQVQTLPILQKIYDRCLTLYEYPLNQGQCESLAQAFVVFPKCINRVLLARNCMADRQLATLLDALHRLHLLKQITIRSN